MSPRYLLPTYLSLSVTEFLPSKKLRASMLFTSLHAFFFTSTHDGLVARHSAGEAIKVSWDFWTTSVATTIGTPALASRSTTMIFRESRSGQSVLSFFYPGVTDSVWEFDGDLLCALRFPRSNFSFLTDFLIFCACFFSNFWKHKLTVEAFPGVRISPQSELC